MCLDSILSKNQWWLRCTITHILFLTKLSSNVNCVLFQNNAFATEAFGFLAPMNASSPLNKVWNTRNQQFLYQTMLCSLLWLIFFNLFCKLRYRHVAAICTVNRRYTSSLVTKTSTRIKNCRDRGVLVAVTENKIGWLIMRGLWFVNCVWGQNSSIYYYSVEHEVVLFHNLCAKQPTLSAKQQHFTLSAKHHIKLVSKQSTSSGKQRHSLLESWTWCYSKYMLVDV